MAGNNAEDDSLDDDSFEDWPAEALLALEEQAVQSTQHGTRSSHPAPVPTVPLYPDGPRRHVGPPNGHNRLPSSDYGNLDEDDVFEADLMDSNETATLRAETVAETKGTGEFPQREQWRVNRHEVRNGGRSSHQAQAPATNTGVHRENGRETFHDEEMSDGETLQKQENNNPVKMEGDNKVLTALQMQIQDLLQEREALQMSLNQAHSTVLSKTGEISIVRANQAKALKESERKVIALQKLHAQEAEANKAKLEQAQKEREGFATEVRFLQRDLTEEGQRVRNLERSVREAKRNAQPSLTRNDTTASPVSTPKKSRTLAIRDGFEDDEMLISPVKTHGSRSKGGTPKLGAKRKRKALEDSPSQPLPLRTQPSQDTADNQGPSDPEGKGPHKVATHNDKFEFMQRIFNHHPRWGYERTFEALTKYTLPSAPERSLSSILMDKFNYLSARPGLQNLAVEFCKLVLSLWEDCLREKLYKPLYLLVDLLQFALTRDISSKAPYLVDDLVPLAQATAEVNAILQFKGLPLPEENAGVNVTECLSLLYFVACGCVQQEVDIERFWQLMRFDFVLMMLSVNQPLEQLLIMVDLLTTSILRKTIGPVMGSGTANENYMIGRLTALLMETPRAVEGKESPRSEVAEMRLEVLSLLSSISCSDHGGETMALHPTAIGRLVNVMHEELNKLYDFHTGHEQSAQQVNIATRILHHLLTAYGQQVDLQATLATIPGGSHKHLVTLTRLAFSEGLVLEAGIEDEVVVCAHHLLEDFVTPEEGEALLGAFVHDRT